MAARNGTPMEYDDIDENEFTETELGILEMLEEGRCTPKYIAGELDRSPEYIRGRLRELKRLGLVHTLDTGLYELGPGEEDDE